MSQTWASFGTAKQQELTSPGTIVTHAHLQNKKCMNIQKKQHILDENHGLQFAWLCMAMLLSRVKQELL